LRNHLTIGHFARLSGLAPRTLRFYDEVGLIRPAAVDPESGYRYYHPGQVGPARLVARLRALEMPLEELKRLLAAPPAEARQVLERHRDRLLERAESQRQAAELVASMLAGDQENAMYEVELRDIPAVPALIVKAHVDHPLDSGPEVVRAFTKVLWPLVHDRGYRVAGPTFFACHDLEGEGGPADLEMVVPISGEATPEGRVEVATVPGGRFAVTIHEGSYKDMGAAYRAVIAWVEAQGLQLVGQSREVYLVDYTVTDDAQALRTEVMYQVG
jgi:DNA-binding transcriptional MerR regulator/effector-binding domain-containing protein